MEKFDYKKWLNDEFEIEPGVTTESICMFGDYIQYMYHQMECGYTLKNGAWYEGKEEYITDEDNYITQEINIFYENLTTYYDIDFVSTYNKNKEVGEHLSAFIEWLFAMFNGWCVAKIKLTQES